MPKRRRLPDHAKSNGVHYTPPELARFLADRTFREVHRRGTIRVLDPACGDGGLLLALAQSVPASVQKRLVLTGYETDLLAFKRAEQTLSNLEVAEVALCHQDFLNATDFKAAQDDATNANRTASCRPERFHVVIANPPYVRTQVLGAKRSQQLAERFQLTGRVDLYHAFVKAMARVLLPDGVLGLLTSNRFLTVRSGSALRQMLSNEFTLKSIIDLGDTKLFKAAVLPVILIATRRQPSTVDCRFDRIYETRDSGSDFRSTETFSSVLEAVQKPACSGLIRTETGLYRLDRGTLAISSDDGWSLSTPAMKQWLQTVADHRECVFSDVGQVRVGIKTTADAVFIHDWTEVPKQHRPESALLRPLLTHVEADRWFLDRSVKLQRILYPHTSKAGRKMAVNLADFPRAASYLNSYHRQLSRRKYVLNAGRKWYEIWVPQDPAAWKQPKLVYPDISEHPRFFLDTSGSLVNGDCYWITLKKEVDPDWLLLMLAVANSTFITRYYDAVHHNKLYSGRRRFMTQYVSGFPLPSLTSHIARRIVRLVSQLIQSGKRTEPLEEQIDHLVWNSFGLKKGSAE